MISPRPIYPTVAPGDGCGGALGFGIPAVPDLEIADHGGVGQGWNPLFLCANLRQLAWLVVASRQHPRSHPVACLVVDGRLLKGRSCLSLLGQVERDLLAPAGGESVRGILEIQLRRYHARVIRADPERNPAILAVVLPLDLQFLEFTRVLWGLYADQVHLKFDGSAAL